MATSRPFAQYLRCIGLHPSQSVGLHCCCTPHPLLLHKLSAPSTPSQLPINSRVTVSEVSGITANGQAFDTTLVDSAATQGLDSDTDAEQALTTYAGRGYSPAVFRLPFRAIPGEMSIEAKFFQTLQFNASTGEYRVTAPTMFPPEMLPNGLQNTLSITADVNTGTPDSGCGCSSHPMSIVPTATLPGLTRFGLQLTAGAAVPNCPLDLTYRAWSREILGSALLENVPGPAGETGGSFLLFVSPPPPTELPGVIGRRVVFLLDNSGSMSGTPMQTAKSALARCLDMLTPADEFGLCVFNSERAWWNPGTTAWNPSQHHSPDVSGQTSSYAVAPVHVSGAGYQDAPPAEYAPGYTGAPATVPANPHNIALCKRYVESVSTYGMTDILTPIQQAYEVLGRPSVEGQRKVPVVFVITDGAVPNERGIASFVKDSNAAIVARGAGQPGHPGMPMAAPRLFTFGIGQWCNHLFLQQLASVGRGFYDASLNVDTLTENLTALWAKSTAPVLLDLAVGMHPSCYTGGLEVYPNPIPDLFCGAPLVVSGRYIGQHPTVLGIRGTLPDGSQWSKQIPVYWTANVPVSKVFAKQQLDLLTASHWMAGGDASSDPAVKQLRQRIVNVSVKNSVPCAYTEMVAFPEKPEKVRERRGRGMATGAQAAQPGSNQPPPPADQPSEAELSKQAKGGGIPTGVKVVGVAAALGAVALVGSVAMSGTDMSGLVGGLDQVGGGIGDAFGALGDAVGSCNCCGADCTEAFSSLGCGNCDAVGGCLDDCFGNVGDCCGDTCSCLPNALSSIVSGCGDGLSQCGSALNCANDMSCLSGAASAVGSCASGFTEGICGELGNVMGSCGECVSSVAGAVPGCCEAAGGMLGSLTDCASGACGLLANCGDVLGSCGDIVGAVLGGICGILGSL